LSPSRVNELIPITVPPFSASSLLSFSKLGQPIVGAITSSSQEKQLNKLIDEAIKNSKK